MAVGTVAGMIVVFVVDLGLGYRQVTAAALFEEHVCMECLDGIVEVEDIVVAVEIGWSGDVAPYIAVEHTVAAAGYAAQIDTGLAGTGLDIVVLRTVGEELVVQ